jgi:hypothetical protein
MSRPVLAIVEESGADRGVPAVEVDCSCMIPADRCVVRSESVQMLLVQAMCAAGALYV